MSGARRDSFEDFCQNAKTPTIPIGVFKFFIKLYQQYFAVETFTPGPIVVARVMLFKY